MEQRKNSSLLGNMESVQMEDNIHNNQYCY